MRFLFFVFFWLFLDGAAFADNEKIILNKANHISLIGAVTQESVDKITADIFANKNDHLYMYISSPGGSVIAGLRLIDAMKSSGKTITCVTDMAMSMAFAILQSCTHRIVAPSAILMQHVSSLTVRGPTPNTIALLELAKALDRRMTRLQASRLGLSDEEFNKKVRNDWWSFGEEAVNDKIADKVSLITCSQDLIDTKLTMPGGEAVSACPVISASVIMSSFKMESLEKIAEIVKSLNSLIFSDQ